MKNFNLTVFVCLTILFSCRERKSDYPAIDQLKWLQGSWITDDSTSIETWALQGAELKGNSYSNREGRITEQLRIYTDQGRPAYEATVIDQNAGKPVSFLLESTTADSLHFSNPGHDFPNHVVYVQQPDGSLLARVYGKDNKGMVLHMTRMAE